jgi:hypothetical protein
MDERTPQEKKGRRGWPWTLFKCAMLFAAFAGLGAVGLWMLLHRIEPPWFIPRVVFAWLVEKAAPFAAWIGAALGAFVGFLGSVVVVIRDARKGRLSKVR